MTAGNDSGPQGGDLVRAVAIDLSTCVNRHRPPPAALDALRNLKPDDILIHPSDQPSHERDHFGR